MNESKDHKLKQKFYAIQLIVCALVLPIGAYYTALEQTERATELFWVTLFSMSIFGYSAYRIWNGLGWPSIPYFSYFFVWLITTTAVIVILQQISLINPWLLAISSAIGLVVMFKYGYQFKCWYKKEFIDRHRQDEDK